MASVFGQAMVFRPSCSSLQVFWKEVLAAVRMGDTHHIRLNKFDDLCSQFAIDHPEYVSKQLDGQPNETALDYSFAVVRDHRIGIMKEIVTERPVDGLKLSFVRWAKHFPRHQRRIVHHPLNRRMALAPPQE